MNRRKGNGATCDGADSTTLIPEASISHMLARINQISVSAWRLEAVRLFELWWRTGAARHLEAFCRHVEGMRAQTVVPTAAIREASR